MQKQLTLRVTTAIVDDINLGIVRIDPELMKEIDVEPGDVVVVKSKRGSIAIVKEAYPGDLDLPIIRMDSSLRRASMIKIDEEVIVTKLKAGDSYETPEPDNSRV